MKVDIEFGDCGDVVFTHDDELGWKIICSPFGTYEVFEVFDYNEPELKDCFDSLSEAYEFVQNLY